MITDKQKYALATELYDLKDDLCMTLNQLGDFFGLDSNNLGLILNLHKVMRTDTYKKVLPGVEKLKKMKEGKVVYNTWFRKELTKFIVDHLKSNKIPNKHASEIFGTTERTITRWRNNKLIVSPKYAENVYKYLKSKGEI